MYTKQGPPHGTFFPRSVMQPAVVILALGNWVAVRLYRGASEEGTQRQGISRGGREPQPPAPDSRPRRPSFRKEL